MRCKTLVVILGILVILTSACVPVASNGPATASPVYIVTPRGNHLEATDPATVNLLSGTPTLVEFFRFT